MSWVRISGLEFGYLSQYCLQNYYSCFFIGHVFDPQMFQCYFFIIGCMGANGYFELSFTSNRTRK